MGKLYTVLLIILILALSGCIATSSSSVDTSSSTTMNKTKAKITATAAPRIIATSTPEIINIGHDNSTVYVEIKGLEFRPSELSIMKGTIVKWKNMDDAQYIINGTDFNSPLLDRRETWSYTFNKTGTFEYGCPLHAWMQHGRITVE